MLDWLFVCGWKYISLRVEQLSEGRSNNAYWVYTVDCYLKLNVLINFQDLIHVKYCIQN